MPREGLHKEKKMETPESGRRDGVSLSRPGG